MKLIAFALVLLSSALTGCSLVPKNSASPTANATYAEALRDAKLWQERAKGRRIMKVSNTGSMAPILGETAIVGLEPVSPLALRQKNIASYMVRIKTPTGSKSIEKLHTVAGFKKGGVVFRAENNGLLEPVPLKSVTGRMAAVFYFKPDRAISSSPRQSNRLPVAAASVSPSPSAGLALLRAKMLTGGGPARLTGNASTLRLVLAEGQSIQLSVGRVGATADTASSVTLAWSPQHSGKAKRYSLYDQNDPDAGNILLLVTYGS